jgi:tetrahydromethanopterin S-methyltransferase subunit B
LQIEFQKKEEQKQLLRITNMNLKMQQLDQLSGEIEQLTNSLDQSRKELTSTVNEREYFK